MNSDIAEAKRRLPLPDLMRRLGLSEHAKKSAHCPFHDDKHNSFSIWQNPDGLWSWKCHAGCGLGDEITFLEKHHNISNSNAIKLFLSMAFDWCVCVQALTDKHAEYIAKWRGYSLSFVKELKDKGQIGIYKGLVAFPVHNNGKIVGTHYRLKSGKWLHFPEGIKAAPLVFGDLRPGKPVQGFESTWDGLDYMDKTGERDGVIITRGATNGKLVAGLISPESSVYAWKQNDELDRRTGKRPADEWLTDVAAQAKAKVLWVRTPAEFKDLNAWTLLRTKAGATKEELREELCAAVKNAKVICEAPTSYLSRNAQAACKLQKDIAAGLDSSGSPADDETLSRLAAMPPLEYKRIREAEAERLGCRVSVLDSLVEAKRPSKPRNDTLQGQAVTLVDMEPWPEPVNGADVLAAVAERIGHYVVMPPGGADITALWCAHTHCYKSFMHTPRLTASSAEKQSGKTTLRDVCAEFVARPILTENTTCAVLFRLVSGQFPTLLADEYDSWIKDNEELRGILNAGHRRGAVVHRCEGEDNEVRGFAVFAPVMLCGIGALPGTLHDRSIVIRLTRAKRGEIQSRFDSRHVEVEIELRRKLARWIADHRVRIEACEPVLPETMFNRVADNWRPIFAIAEIAGGDWPARCVAAYRKLTNGEFEDVETLRVALLTDVQQIFAGTWPSLEEGEEPSPIERIFSKNLCEKLADMKERPWPEVCKGKPITERWLARNLTAFGIRPKLLRIGDDGPARGYEAADFADTFVRYVENSPFEPLHRYNKRENEPDSSVTNNETCNGSKSDPYRGECNAVTDKKGGGGEMDESAPLDGPLIDELGVVRL
jgi:hypothetical protein